MSIQFPETIGACIDALYSARAKRLDLSKQVDLMAEIEKQYENHILETFSKSDLKGAKGDTAMASIKKTTVYQISNWDSFTKYVADTGDWELMRKQPGTRACAERFDNGTEIPGIEPFVKVGLSLTKT